jgi:hypothetical protein
MVESNTRQATPIELAALMMDAVCTPSEQEEDALRELAAHLRVPLATLQTELLFLRAFAVDFAASVSLADAPEKTAVVDQYNGHWGRIGNEAGEAVLEDLEVRLTSYAEAAADTSPNPDGLRGRVGGQFAAHCTALNDGASNTSTAETGADLAFLGGSMFAALFEEMADLFETVDIVLPTKL